MDNCENQGIDPVTAFDTLYTSNQLQMLKIVLPYMQEKMQRFIAIYIKLNELLLAFHFSSGTYPVKKENDFTGMLKYLSPYLSDSEKDMMNQFTSMQENMEQFKEITKDIGADIVALNTPIIDTTQHKDLLGTLVTDIILSVLNYETESDYMQRRIDQKQGIDLWRKTKQTKTGRPYGRPKVERPTNWNEVIALVENNQITKVEAMKRLNLKKNKFYEFYNSEKKK